VPESTGSITHKNNKVIIMSVNALYDYKFEPRDKVENFNGMQLVYVQWAGHLMFCAPFALLVKPDMTFRALIDEVLKPAVGSHPESVKADFLAAEWQLNGEPFAPDVDASLVDNGIDHKSMLVVTTPGLDGMFNTGY